MELANKYHSAQIPTAAAVLATLLFAKFAIQLTILLSILHIVNAILDITSMELSALYAILYNQLAFNAYQVIYALNASPILP